MRKQTIILATAIFLILGIFAQVFPLRSQGAGVRVAAKPGMDSAFVQWLDSLLVADSTFITDSVLKDPEYLFYPIDTMKVPDSLEYADTFRYKYFLALRDSATLAATRDSLLARSDTLTLQTLDSIWKLDSTAAAKWRFDKWYWGLSKKERKAYDKDRAMAARNAARLAYLEAKDAREDSLRAIRDSIRENTPRILETWVLPDSLQYKRLIMWNLDRTFDDLKLVRQDTSFNYHFPDYSIYRDDVNANWLGVSGSPAQSFNFLKRAEQDNAFFYSPYLPWTFTPENLPQYNTKTPYTELWYSGTLFNGQEKEDLNVGVLVSQNFTPALNLTLGIYRYGAKGYLQNEETVNRTAHVGLNYLGKKYSMHGGFIYNHIERMENGGVIDTDPKTGVNWIRDTTVDSREIAVRLNNANSAVKRYTAFLDQNYRFQMSFFKKKDTTARVDVDSLDRDVTSAIIGHSSEFSVHRRVYKDQLTTATAKAFYPNNYLYPYVSNDSLRCLKLENKVYLRLQPWKSDGVVSKLDVGVADRFLFYSMPTPDMYLVKTKGMSRNTFYVYAGVKGQYEKYFDWNAQGHYNFAGAEIGGFHVGGNILFNLYPFRRARESPLSFVFHAETDLKTPDLLLQHYFSNHYKWDNDFKKVSRTNFSGGIEIPHWDMNVKFDYTLLGNYIYFDTDALPKQWEKPFSVFSLEARKDFTLWKFHLENRLLAQYSTNEQVLPLPYLSVNLRWYFQFTVVKKVMEMQFGINAWYTTQWYMQVYNPATGAFYNQFDSKYGDTPIFDAFLNIQWKRCCIYIKLENANMGWPMRSTDYFSAPHYIRAQRSVKVGIFWPFYLSHISNPPVKK